MDLPDVVSPRRLLSSHLLHGEAQAHWSPIARTGFHLVESAFVVVGIAWARDDDDQAVAQLDELRLGGGANLLPKAPLVLDGRAGTVYLAQAPLLLAPNRATVRARIGEGGSLRVALVVVPR